MEYVSGIKLKDILLDNGTWWKLFVKHRHLIRISIIINVLKLLVCKTGLLGYHYFICPECRKSIKVPHSCKSRFCSSCGKKATDNWIKTNLNLLPKTTWQHITFTMPKELWDFFWVNLYLMNKTPKIAAHIIKTLAKQKGIIPGIFLANHTFGRDLKRNIHIHLSTTTGGLSSCNDSWQKGTYFYHETLKKMWRYHLIALFREEFKQGLMRCTYCYEEMDFSARQVRMLMATTYDPVCTIKDECHLCHTGFMVPVKYKDKSGNIYLFHEIKPKIKNLDPNTVMERIFQHQENGNAYAITKAQEVVSYVSVYFFWIALKKVLGGYHKLKEVFGRIPYGCQVSPAISPLQF